MDPTWAIVELMGHNVIAGQVSEETIAGQAFVRVDVPEIDGRPAFTKWFSGAAIYAITPTDEATAMQAVQRLQARPVSLYVLPQLPAPERRWEYEDEGPAEEEEAVLPPGRRCGNCGEWRDIQDGLVVECPHCGDDAWDPYEEPPF